MNENADNFNVKIELNIILKRIIWENVKIVV